MAQAEDEARRGPRSRPPLLRRTSTSIVVNGKMVDGTPANVVGRTANLPPVGGRASSGRPLLRRTSTSTMMNGKVVDGKAVASPPPSPVPPPPPCDNATRTTPYRECSWTVMIGARDSSHSWTPIEKVVKACAACRLWAKPGSLPKTSAELVVQSELWGRMDKPNSSQKTSEKAR